jgi:hypothetical protein
MMQFQQKPGNNNNILFLSKFIIHDSANLNEKRGWGFLRAGQNLTKHGNNSQTELIDNFLEN